jgi:hypothetical protein
MTSLNRFILIAIALTVISLGTAARTNADPLVLTIDNPNPTATPGTWITFTGTLTNSTLLGYHLVGIGLLDDLGLVRDIAYPPNFLTSPGPMSTVSGDVMNVLISPTIAPGSYNATLFLGGLFADNSVAYASYQVNVTVTNPSAVPEPASMFLFGTGLIGAAALARRHRKRSRALCHYQISST